WVALSRVWSEAPSHTVAEVQRDLMYPLAFLVALVLLRRSIVTTFVGAIAVAVDALALYGLLTRLFPERLGSFDSISAYRLSSPVGYWNSLGIVTAMGIVLTLGFAVRGRIVPRALAAAALVGLAPTLYFTFSRGAVIALALGSVALVVLDTRRLQLTIALLFVLPLPVLATVVATHYDALVTTGAPLADATRDGHRLALVLVPLALAAAFLGAALALVERHWVPGTWLRRGYAVVVCGVAIAAAVAVIGHFGGPETMVRDAVDSFRGPPVGSSQSGVDLTQRFGSLSSNGRITLWSAAWDDFRRNPVAGAGAGSFEWYWAKHQPIPGKARDAHSLYAETLAELGVVGLGLIVLAVLLPLGGILRARRRPVMPFAAAAYVAFIAHLGADWDWEVPVIVLAGLLCAAALLAAARRTDEPVELRPWLRAPAVAAVALVGVFAFTALIGVNALAAAQEAQAGGNPQKAVDQARKATDWMPWSAEAYKELGTLQRQLGDLRGARASYRKAIELEPLDYAAWLDLGYVTRGRQSRRAFATAARLYPFNGATPPPAQPAG
ncbi:MAG: O-antigen ligase family protein, partial [Gaiellaceae bacterium]